MQNLLAPLWCKKAYTAGTSGNAAGVEGSTSDASGGRTVNLTDIGYIQTKNGTIIGGNIPDLTSGSGFFPEGSMISVLSSKTGISVSVLLILIIMFACFQWLRKKSFCGTLCKCLCGISLCCGGGGSKDKKKKKKKEKERRRKEREKEESSSSSDFSDHDSHRRHKSRREGSHQPDNSKPWRQRSYSEYTDSPMYNHPGTVPLPDMGGGGHLQHSSSRNSRDNSPYEPPSAHRTMSVGGNVFSPLSQKLTSMQLPSSAHRGPSPARPRPYADSVGSMTRESRPKSAIAAFPRPVSQMHRSPSSRSLGGDRQVRSSSVGVYGTDDAVTRSKGGSFSHPA
eukprot:gene1479-32863_t